MAQASKTFRLFVSSTFSDLKEERNALLFLNPRYPGTKISRLTVTATCRRRRPIADGSQRNMLNWIAD